MYKVCINANYGILCIMSLFSSFLNFFFDISKSCINLVTSHGAKHLIKLYLDVSHLDLQRNCWSSLITKNKQWGSKSLTHSSLHHIDCCLMFRGLWM